MVFSANVAAFRTHAPAIFYGTARSSRELSLDRNSMEMTAVDVQDSASIPLRVSVLPCNLQNKGDLRNPCLAK